ncbi:hypothetical protein [Neoaquamicrobium sediminum]|uniref:hypothetical protein n=1 Tax=Neoaquamicrobium sediminum TaxID=1849104 RepID=UPI003606336F
MLVAVAILPGLQACMAPPPEEREPIIIDMPRPPSATHRLIVQYGQGDPNGHERRILQSLQGYNHRVINSMPGGRTIILETDQRGLERLEELEDVTVHQDSVSGPTN